MPRALPASSFLIPGVFRAADAVPAPKTQEWGLSACMGRLVEISGTRGSARLTAACGLIADAQREGEHVAWISLRGSIWFAPDLADSGIDLDALIVVRLARLRDAARAADELVRSKAFGLLVIDASTAGRGDVLPLAGFTRLAGLVHAHDTALVFLTRAADSQPSLASLIALRAEARHASRGDGHFETCVRVLKDKRRGPGALRMEICRGPAGVC